MTHVLVVHHDPDMADQECDWLRAAGYSVEQCAGPQHGPCPVLSGKPCIAVDTSNVLVYDVWSTGDTQSEQELIEILREVHPETPIVLTSPGIEFDWVQTTGLHAVIEMEGTPSSARLTKAVAQALTSVGKADLIPTAKRILVPIMDKERDQVPA
jgi:DNA-binding NtrC family response regulator